MPIIAAWTVNRCEASTLRWIVALTFAAAGRVTALAADRLRALPFLASDDSAIMPPLRLDDLPPRHTGTRTVCRLSSLVSATPLPCCPGEPNSCVSTLELRLLATSHLTLVVTLETPQRTIRLRVRCFAGRGPAFPR